MVSVPFPGILFLNDPVALYKKCKKAGVSVPFPGILFLNWTARLMNKYLPTVEFPSPFRGSYFSILKILLMNFIQWVSVPFPGILFLNLNTRVKQRTIFCFRPLSGDLISQLVRKEAQTAGKKFVSVPFPGILFLNLTDVDGQLGVISFPSPSRGSYFSIMKTLKFENNKIYRFPSPSRGSYFSISWIYAIRWDYA